MALKSKLIAVAMAVGLAFLVPVATALPANAGVISVDRTDVKSAPVESAGVKSAPVKKDGVRWNVKTSAVSEARVLTLKYSDTCVAYVTYKGNTWVAVDLDTKCPSYTVQVVLYRADGSKVFDSGYWRSYPRSAANLRWGGGSGCQGGWGQLILRDNEFQQIFTASRNFV